METILGPSAENDALWRERSPLNALDRVRAPVLLLHGADDRVVWPAQSEAVVRELARHGVDHEYVCYPGEGHGFRRVATVTDCALRIDRYLSQKVLRAPEAGPLGVLPYPPAPPAARRGAPTPRPTPP